MIRLLLESCLKSNQRKYSKRIPGISAANSVFCLHLGQPQSIEPVTVNDSVWSRFHLESNQGHVMFFLSKLLSFSGTMTIVSLAALFRSSVQLHEQK